MCAMKSLTRGRIPNDAFLESAPGSIAMSPCDVPATGYRLGFAPRFDHGLNLAVAWRY
jgi:hypothetical protein